MGRTVRTLTLLALAGCTAGGEPERPGHGVLVIAVDCLRADHCSLYGYDRETTPILSELADEGIVFTQTYATTPDMLVSHISVVTGCDPRIAVRPPLPDGTEFSSSMTNLFIPEGVPRLGRAFLSAGFRTSAYADNQDFSRPLGFHAGYEKFFEFREGELNPTIDYGFAGVVLRFKSWVRGLDADEDWFAYLQVQDLERIWGEQDPQWDHFFEPRDELDVVPPLSTAKSTYFAIPRNRWSGGARTLGEYEAQYDGNLRETDQNIGRLVDWLERKGRWENTTLVVVGTYGIGFGEEGLVLDSGTLTDVDLRVPWLIRPAKSLGLETGIVHDGLASLIDVAPTLIDLFGLPELPGMHGVSHKDALRGRERARELAFAAGGVQRGFAVMTQDDTFLRILPGARGPQTLMRSYTGVDRPSRLVPMQRVFDRTTNEPIPPDDPRVERMHDSGQDWFEWVVHARDVVHPVAWEREPLDDAIVDELLDRGLIAERP